MKPGQKIQLAVFGINGPISNPPTNFIWVREAKLDFYKGESTGPIAITPSEVNVEVVQTRSMRSTRSSDRIRSSSNWPKDFKFTEGPVWIGDGLLFSDPNANTIYKYSQDGQLSVFKTPSGYSGADIAEYRQPGSNGITLDPQGNIVFDQHGNRRVVRDWKRTEAKLSLQISSRASDSIRRTISSIDPTARCSLRIRTSVFRNSGTIRERSLRTPAFIRSTKVRFNS